MSLLTLVAAIEQRADAVARHGHATMDAMLRELGKLNATSPRSSLERFLPDNERRAIETLALCAAVRVLADALKEARLRCNSLKTSAVTCVDGDVAPFDDVYGGYQACEKCAEVVGDVSTAALAHAERLLKGEA
jgi:hypothetical protein